MSTAVIISGVLRHMINASSSWLVDADYYLITENKIYTPQSTNLRPITSLNIINDTVDQSSVKFSAVNILNNNEMMFSKQQLTRHPEFAYHPTINMAFKWKYAFNILNSIQSAKQYNKILLWRPDMYIRYQKPLAQFAKRLPTPKHYHRIGPMHIDPVTKYPTVGDTGVMVDWEMFKLLSEFFDYFLYYYEDALKNKFDVHSLLARYLIERAITIDGSLSEYLDYIILRDNTESMFKNGMLCPEFSFEDLRDKQYQWWKENTVNEK